MIKKIILTSILIIGLSIFSSTSFAQENDWEEEFVQTLQDARSNNSGSGYATADSSGLDTAIKRAMDLSAPPDQVIKIAVEQGYSAYAVIKKVLGYGGKIDLDQLCMYANQLDINKQLLAKAAKDARMATALCNPVYSQDEIAQAQCIREVGLGYTPVATAKPGRVGHISPKKDPKPFSVSVPI